MGRRNSGGASARVSASSQGGAPSVPDPPESAETIAEDALLDDVEAEQDTPEEAPPVVVAPAEPPRVEEQSKPPAPAPPPPAVVFVEDPPPAVAAPAAPANHVLAHWFGLGTYDGPFFDLQMKPRARAKGPTVGYFPAGSVKKLAAHFKLVG